ncbi:hypothetical protein M2272_005569 [Mycobacterium frederiksbergense]|uniref:Uncharacterized protein n=1 Tax=Mycolicibacterium frederiksbergense TaxID=117567 RepID=A0ABT6LA99_9MYCO|nr:hypothetical protein [Mycolicibacterium frederiksbergense]MDH6198905.1 hypothetical protein [Mycolicibacterium frederiksbergense]
MSDMFEVLSMMAAPLGVLLAMRWLVIRQNRAADQKAGTDST